VRLDLADGTAIDEIVARFQPGFVFHAAALARPQQHNDPDSLRRINVDATDRLARACSSHGAALVYISTDLVYSPDAGVCDENTPVNLESANEYARTKYAGEQAVRASASQWLILRSTLMFGNGTPTSNSFTQFLDRNWDERKPAPVFTDQVRAFLYGPDLVAAVDRLVNAGDSWNSLFVCGGDEALSRYEFALRYAAARGVDASLCSPMRSTDLKGYRGGPGRIVLDSRRLRETGWRPRSLEEAFREMVQR
jgi:dTDP-4-dehydrorhamnose reductase